MEVTASRPVMDVRAEQAVNAFVGMAVVPAGSETLVAVHVHCCAAHVSHVPPHIIQSLVNGEPAHDAGHAMNGVVGGVDGGGGGKAGGDGRQCDRLPQL